MKNYILWLTPLLMFGRSEAQTFYIDTSDISFENKLRPCFSVVYDADAKTTKQGWVDFLKKNHKIKAKGIGLFSNKDILDAEDVTLASISDKRLNLYARVIDLAKGSEMKFFASFGYDFFIGPQEYPKEFAGMKNLLNDFSIRFLNDYYKDEAARLTKKVKGLEKDIKSNERSISKNKKKARKESDAVAAGLDAKNNSLQMEIENKRSEIESLKKELEGIKEKQGGITRS